ncbi:MAG: hypothetical protein A2Y25_09555 [Candidatus Melainabacteria bacterium GWF2_37_15]|nr:MAG: hypothetical protein A2Y25_09555 [Candidatus Melainabacteria bacterium GWF2_37_15]
MINPLHFKTYNPWLDQIRAKLDLPSESYTVIKEEEWNRKQISNVFKAFDNPFTTMTANVDITNLRNVSKEKKLPISDAILYMIGKTVKDIPEFHYRFKDNKVVKYDDFCLGMTFANDKDLYNYVNLDYSDDPLKFIKNVKQKSEEGKIREGLFDEPRENAIYLSCVPWVNFTSLASPVNNYAKDSAPRIVWGGFSNDKTTMPVALEVHHSFMDGRHMGMFYRKLQENLNNAREIFRNVGN